MKITTSPILIVSILVCLGLSPSLHAVSPPPDGGYPGGNTAEGTNALLSQTTGVYNTAVGIYSILSLSNGNFCTGVGAGTLLANTADQNTATGAGALLSNTTGLLNTANGAFALLNNTIGAGNTASGQAALAENISGQNNTAYGPRLSITTQSVAPTRPWALGPARMLRRPITLSVSALLVRT